MNTKNPYIFINSFILFQYPKGLGNTVEEVKISNAVGVFPKTKFSMLVPDVEAAMSDLCRGEIKHVILCGIEVFISYIKEIVNPLYYQHDKTIIIFWCHNYKPEVSDLNIDIHCAFMNCKFRSLIFSPDSCMYSADSDWSSKTRHWGSCRSWCCFFSLSDWQVVSLRGMK